MWVLDAGLLMLNARCITKGMVKSRLTSCLLLIANNLLNQVICTRILTISLVFWTQMRKENLCRKKISQVSIHVALFTLALIGDCQFFLTVSKYIVLNHLFGSNMVRHMLLVLVLSLLLRVLYLMRCTHNALW